MAFEWTQETMERSLDLRLNHDVTYGDIAVLLGANSATQIKSKIQRLLAPADSSRGGGEVARGEVRVPEPDEYEYDWSLIEDAGPREQSRTTKEKETFVVDVPYARRNYTFRQDPDGEGYFVFHLNGHLVEIREETWTEIITLYSHAGGDLTQYEVASEFGLNQKELQHLLKQYGHVKARPPVTREELASIAGDEEEEKKLVERTIEVAERRFSRRLEKKSNDFYRKEYFKLREKLERQETLQESIRSILVDLDLERALTSIDKDRMLGANVEISCAGIFHCPLFDPHYGLRVEGKLGWGEDYDLEIALAYTYLMTDLQVAHIKRQCGGKAKKIYATNGGDIFHAFLRMTETFSHVLERDRPDMIVWRKVVKAMRYRYNRLREICEQLFIVDVPGNHGHIFDELLTEFMIDHYSDADDVQIDDRLGQYKHFRVGDAIHVLDHGKGLGKTSSDKTARKADTTARTVARDDYAGSKIVYYYIGHTHHVEVTGHGPHLEIIRVPTFSHADDYAGRIREISVPTSQVFELNDSGMIVGSRRFLMAEELQNSLIHRGLTVDSRPDSLYPETDV